MCAKEDTDARCATRRRLYIIGNGSYKEGCTLVVTSVRVWFRRVNRRVRIRGYSNGARRGMGSKFVGMISTPHELDPQCVVVLPCEGKRAREMAGRSGIDKLAG